jgi:hypothetical protein
VQLLGEAGWPGIVLWFAFLGSLVALTASGWIRGGSRLSLFMAAQVISLVAAMSVDYVIEHPFGKFQFFLVVFLCLAGEDAPLEMETTRTLHLLPCRVFAAALTVVALLNLVYFVGFGRKLLISGHLTREYLNALPSQDPSRRRVDDFQSLTDVRGLQQVVALGRDFDGLDGHTKSMFRDHLLIADALRRLGQMDRAKAFIVRSLELHPYHPTSFQVMSRMLRDPGSSEQWQGGYRYLMDEAVDGYRRPYPTGHPLARTD